MAEGRLFTGSSDLVCSISSLEIRQSPLLNGDTVSQCGKVGGKKRGGKVLRKKYVAISTYVWQVLLVMNEEVIVPRKKEIDCECTWHVRKRNSARRYDHFPAALVTRAV